MDEKLLSIPSPSSIPAQTLPGWENFQVLDMDGKPSGIVLMVESKEQSHKLPKGSDHEFELPFPMCPDEHEYDFCWYLCMSSQNLNIGLF